MRTRVPRAALAILIAALAPVPALAPVWAAQTAGHATPRVRFDSGDARQAATLTPDGQWKSPTPSFAHAFSVAIYDSIRYRMLLFGGYGAGYISSVYELRLSGNGAWTEVPASGNGLPARVYASAIYDPLRDRMVVFGGMTSDLVEHNDVWALSLNDASWSQLEPLGDPPSPSIGHTAIYDPVQDRMIVFGGQRYDASVSSDVTNSEMWALSLSDPPTWTRIDAGPGPSARFFHTAIFDPPRSRMIVFGGRDVSGVAPNDVWALSLSGPPSWTPLAATGTPYRWGHSATYDPVGDRMLIVAGGDTAAYHGDVWAMSLTGSNMWTIVSPDGVGPSPRDAQSAITDPVRNQLVVSGGTTDSSGPLRDTWSLDLSGIAGWVQVGPTVAAAPIARFWHSAIYDPVNGETVVFAGLGATLMNDVWALSPTANAEWTELAPSGAAPAVRWGHVAVFDPVRQRMLVFGGNTVNNPVFDVWALSLSDTLAWTQLASAPDPSVGGFYGSAVYDSKRDRMVVFGGDDVSRSQPTNRTWALNLSGEPSWTELVPSGALAPARESHGAIYDSLRDRMIVFGGFGIDSMLSDVWALAFSPSPHWEQLAAPGPGGTRAGHTAIYDPSRDRMVVFGGATARGVEGDAWALALADPPTWSRLNPAGPPPGPRLLHSAVYDSQNDRMIVFGGNGGTWPGQLDDLWYLDWGQGVPGVSALGASVSVSGVRLLWVAGSTALTQLTLYRQQEGGPWSDLGQLQPDSSGHLTYLDTPPLGGIQYNYGIGNRRTGPTALMGEITVESSPFLVGNLHGSIV